jgi:hypothetical protein
VFAVKQPPRSRTALWLFLGLGGLSTLAIGGYFWWQLQSLSNGALVSGTAADACQQARRQAAGIGRQRGCHACADGANHARSPADIPRQRRRNAQSQRPGQAAPVGSGCAGTKGESQHPAAAGGRLVPGEQQPGQTGPDAEPGLRSLAGKSARTTHKAATNRFCVATPGIPTRSSAWRRSPPAAASSSVRRNCTCGSSKSDPGDVSAQAALINLRAQNDTGSSESRLKTLLASQPDSSALHFTLGNLYARQGRWSDAQQAYFQAYAADPDNADYIFNVAVSLDHLRQSKLAAQYYQMALSVAATRPSAFDRQAAEKRILELQP